MLLNFRHFRSICEILLTVDYCNMDERLESLWLLVYYRYQESQGLLTVVVDRTLPRGVWTCAQAIYSLIIAA